MILFKKDWAKYPTAIADDKTTNASFLRLAYIYKKMGVENYAFPLALIQPYLQGVDPFSTDLDDETKMAITLECRYNPWYCLREVIRLPPQGGPTPIRYKASRGNIALTWSYFNHLDIALIQPRQTGKSASTDCIWIIALYLMGSHTSIQLFTKNDDLRKENIQRLKGIREQLPPYLNPTESTDADNKEMLTCLARNNFYKTAIAISEKEAAYNIGRGMTSPNIHIDEVPYIKNGNLSIPVLLASATAAVNNSKQAGGLYGNIFTTTAGKKDTPQGKYAYNLIYSGMAWNEMLLDCNSTDELYGMVLNNSTSRKPIVYAQFNHRQLGYTDDWLREAIANARGNKDDVDRDFLNIWTSGTESSPLSIALNETIHMSEREPDHVEVTKDGYHLRWYIPRSYTLQVMDSTHHFICLDSSNAIGKDANGITLLDVRTMAVIMAANLAEANLFKFAKWLADFLIMYPKTTLIIENKSSAQGIIDALLTILPSQGIDPFKRIYNRVVDNKEKYVNEWKELERPLHTRRHDVYLKLKGHFGFMTSASSRPFLYDTVLQQAAKTSGHLVRDAVLSEEIRSLVTVNGKVDHQIGGHDDVCFSWLLGQWMARFSKNLDFYGVEPGLCLSEVMDDGATASEEDMAKIASRKRTRLEIEKLKKDLSEEQSSSDRFRTELLLKQKVKEAENDGGMAVSIESVIAEAESARKKKKSLRESLNRLNKPIVM